jgi:pimeloyl-ACP methyl ester carboxylesterase
MTAFTTSADGTRIAFDRMGDGPPLVVLGGIFNTRATTRALAEALSEHFTVLNPDRRGRGDSGDESPSAAEREVEDVAALLAEVGGEAALYGHSSGAGLALEAGAAGLPITRLVLHEPPYADGSDEASAEARAMAQEILTALDEGRLGDAIKRFMRDFGLPPEALEATAADPDMLAVAPSMAHDMAVMGELDGGALPVGKVRSISVPTLVVAGTASGDFFLDTANRVADLLPDGRLALLDGADHGAPPDVVAPVVTEFLRG